jgi:hypothetical protein
MRSVIQQALASPSAGRAQTARYDLRRALALGRPDRALDAFGRIVELDAGFQDVARASSAAERLAAARADAQPREPGEAYGPSAIRRRSRRRRTRCGA